MRLRMPHPGALSAADDPVADLDRDLARLAADLRGARLRGEDAMAARLTDVIDLRLDERGRCTSDVPAPYCP